MLELFDIGIFGGDLRQVYIALAFLAKGYSVTAYNLADTIKHDNFSQAPTLSELYNSSTLLIGPIPMSRDQITLFSNNPLSDMTIAHAAYLLSDNHILVGGQIPAPIIELCRHKHIPYYDLMSNEKIIILNAIATAEGTIMEAITRSSCNLHSSKCLILGFGRCAKVLGAKLKALDARVTIAARSEDALAYAYASGHDTLPITDIKNALPTFDFIFNTVPSFILDKDCLNRVSDNVTIIDISSAPGGVDFDYAKKHNINANLCLGLPGRVSPRSSADILVSEVLTFINERSD